MNDEVMVPTVTLEDGVEYIVLDTLDIHENQYVILTLENDPETILVQRVVEKDIFVSLDNSLELDGILHAFFSKHPELKSQNM